MVSKGLSKVFIRLLFLVFVIVYYFLLMNNTEIIYASTPTPNPPTVSDSPDPQQGGGDISFSCSGCSAASGETIKLFICKSNDLRCVLESEWSYKVPITIDNTQNSNSLTDYQVLVTIDTGSLISAGKMRNDCGDIRFFDPENPSLQLNYWMESGCNSGSTKIWVRVPSIPASSTKTIYMYYGNPDATSESNADEVFVFFDDFSNGLDTSKWDDPYVIESHPSYPLTSGSYTFDDSVGERPPSIKFTTTYSGVGRYGTDSKPITVDTNSQYAIGYWVKGEESGAENSGEEWILNSSKNTWVRYVYTSSIAQGEYVFTPPTSTIYIRIDTLDTQGYQTLSSWHDYVYLRKYTNPEPTVSIGSEQTTDSSSYLWTKSSTAVSSNPSAIYTCPSCTYSINTYYGATFSVEEGVWTSFTSPQTFTCKKENTCTCSENSECYSGACKLDPDGAGEFCCNSNQCSHDGSCSTLVELTSIGSNACIEGENIAHNSAGSSHPRYAAFDGQLYYCGTDNTDKSPYSQVTNLIPGDAIGRCRCKFDGNFDCSSVVIKGWKSRFRILPT